jgi:hypothetical protein
LGDGRTWHLVASAGVEDVRNENAPVVIIVGAGKRNQVARVGSAGLIASNNELNTTRIEFGTSSLSSEMESDNFVAEEVVTRGKV